MKSLMPGFSFGHSKKKLRAEKTQKSSKNLKLKQKTQIFGIFQKKEFFRISICIKLAYIQLQTHKLTSKLFKIEVHFVIC